MRSFVKLLSNSLITEMSKYKETEYNYSLYNTLMMQHFFSGIITFMIQYIHDSTSQRSNPFVVQYINDEKKPFLRRL